MYMIIKLKLYKIIDDLILNYDSNLLIHLILSLSDYDLIKKYQPYFINFDFEYYFTYCSNFNEIFLQMDNHCQLKILNSLHTLYKNGKIKEELFYKIMDHRYITLDDHKVAFIHYIKNSSCRIIYTLIRRKLSNEKEFIKHSLKDYHCSHNNCSLMKFKEEALQD
jgi:hypothetical protein